MNIIEKIIAKKYDVKNVDPVTIAFLGDSVTQGCFELYKTSPDSFETEFRVEQGYHTKLRDILQMLYPNVPINMIHAGISGGKAEQGFLRVQRDVCAYRPDLTIVCFGLNDCCRGLDYLEVYKNSISGIIDSLKECGSEIIFMTPNRMAEKVSEEVTDEYTRNCYAEMIKTGTALLDTFVESAMEICAQKSVPVCDCYKYWTLLKEKHVDITRLLANRINHPTEKMHWLFAFKLVETMFEN